MISLRNRFHGHNSLRQTYQKGKNLYSPHFKCIYMPLAGENYKVAVVVSKKVHKSAVGRNRIRRRVYEVVRLYMQQTPKNVQLVIVVLNDEPITMTADALGAEIQAQLQKM